jgi:predicted nucleotidyltransferase
MREAVAALQIVDPDTRVEFMNKSDLRSQLLTDLAPRQRAAAMRVLLGTVDRTFPDRTRKGDPDGPSLHRLNDAVAIPSARRMRALARVYRLRRILAFGSATRADFRPDSDIDLVVEPLPGHHLGLDQRVGLMADAERLFGRDVDILAAPVRRPSLAHRIDRDAVVLFDETRDKDWLERIVDCSRLIDAYVARAGAGWPSDDMAVDAIARRIKEIGEIARD